MGRRPICVLCLLLIAFLVIADRAGMPLIRGNPLPAELKAEIEKLSEVSALGEVERVVDTESSQSVYLKNVSFLYESKKISIGNLRVFLKKSEELPAGSLVLVQGIPEEIGGSRNPGEFNSRQYYACRHMYYVMKKGVVVKRSREYSRFRQFLRELQERLGKILDSTAGKSAPIFRAIVLGDKGELETETKMRYQMAGIIHILAISGLHISLLGVGLYELLKKAGLGIWPSGMASLVIMLCYGMMTGGSVSTMRAVIMFLISVGAKILGRIYDMPTALSLAAILILAESPSYLLEGGFWLSFGAVVGIGIVAPVLEEILGCSMWEDKEQRTALRTGRKISKALVASAAVHVTTLPVMLTAYGEVSVAGIFLNLLVLPTVGVVLGSGVLTAAVGLGWRIGAVICALPGRGLLAVYEEICRLAEKLPFCTWIGGRPGWWQMGVYYAILAAIIVGWKKIKEKSEGGSRRRGGFGLRLVMLSLLIFGIYCLAWRPSGKFRITCLDVGQGDAIVVETAEGRTFLVDGGSSNKKGICQYQILPYLKYRGISRIDAVFISHTDGDHISGIREFLEYQVQGLTSVKIGRLILPGWSSPPKEWETLAALARFSGIPVLTANAGDKFQSGEAEFQVLSPEEGASGENVNEEAAVMELIYGDFHALFTGDMGTETEEKLLKEGVFEDVDYLKVGHHGSRYASSEKFLSKVKPEIAVISVSETNTYGHPSPETIERLEESGAKVFCTKDYGAVTAEVNGGEVCIWGYVKKDG